MFRPNTLKDMKEMADRAIRAREAKGAKDIPDLLDLLLAGEDPETKKRMNTDELRDNLLTFIVAGHETTALTLSWALYLCAFDPSVQDKLRAEAQSVLRGRTATAQDCPNLPYTEQVIKETLRLYPPAAIVSRTAQAHDTLRDREIRPGDTVMMPFYALHRNHALWPDPDRFDPERFAKGAKYDRFSYLPFGDGPRVCIGASFAMTEATVILSTLISRFRFTRIPGRDPKPVMLLTLRPQGGVQLLVEAV
jgi:cytochrome P450